MADTIADPVTQARQLIADARQQFARDVDAILADVRIELRQVILERFDEYVPMRHLADPVLLQLVREAYDHFENPDSRISIKEWVREARTFVEPTAWRKRA